MRHDLVRTAGPSRLAIALTTALLAAGITAPGVSGQVAASDDPPLRVAIVQLDAVALQSPAGQQLQARIVAFQEDLAEEMTARQAAATAIERRIAEADSLVGEERRVIEREYQDVVTEFQRFQQDKQEEANLMRDEGLAAIQQQIGPVLEALQVDEGYDLVLNGQSDLIVIFSERIDITQLVIDRLHSEAGAGSGPGS